MRLRVLGISLITIFTLTNTALSQPKMPCFAFLLKADVTLVCNGETSRITYFANIEHFAVSDDSSAFAWVTSRPKRLNAVTSEVTYTTIVVNLKTGSRRQIHVGNGVVASCGGILPNAVGEGSLTSLDVVTGSSISFPPYAFFRCSADRRVIAGVPGKGSAVQPWSGRFRGVPPSAKLAIGADVYPHYFNMSPDGSKIAWFNDFKPLCVLSGSSPASCVDHSTITDPVSVNDGGELLVTTGTGKGCDYKNSFNFSPARNGVNGNDECLGIGYWKAGLKSIALLQTIGRNPQWLSPATANLLRSWSRSAGGR